MVFHPQEVPLVAAFVERYARDNIVFALETVNMLQSLSLSFSLRSHNTVPSLTYLSPHLSRTAVVFQLPQLSHAPARRRGVS